MQSMTQIEVRAGHAVYIARDADRVPVYVGYSAKLYARIGQHQATSAWWPEAATVEVEWFGTAADARARERELISHYQPAHNVVHRDPKSLEIQRQVANIRCGRCGYPATHEHRRRPVCEDCIERNNLRGARNILDTLRQQAIARA